MKESYLGEKQPDRVIVKNRGEATARILATFRNAQKENYSELDFHNEKHPEMVRRKALEFAKILMREDPTLVTKDTLANIVNSAASHDSVLNVARGEMITRFRGFFDTDTPGNVRALMTQHGVTKGNEWLSAEWLEHEFDRYVGADGNQGFDPKSKTEMIDAIAATFPDFDFAATIPNQDFEQYFSSPQTQEAALEKYRTGIKVSQPHLKAESSITALAVATGDLRGEVLSDNYEDYRQSGNGEFRELNEGLHSAIERGVGTITHDQRIKVAANMLKWVKAQVTFAMWQKILFWESINKNNLIAGSSKAVEIKRALKDHYDSNFDTNILKAKERYERLEKKYGESSEQRADYFTQMTNAGFQELLDELGFPSYPTKNH
ncbi:MAG: hypothetical protein A3J67_02915 [Parcubacteria group bacterium RIFCSPHIGHO2_02_FULL_48_10b]|nr:MAG: hypothetical protein A3J67_02915 [Parcubacteria group bacterium RIFCSPHIGHO2_02_FULL_48_10b]